MTEAVQFAASGGLARVLPVRLPITGATEARLLHEGLQQHHLAAVAGRKIPYERRRGHGVSHSKVAQLLKHLDYRRQGTRSFERAAAGAKRPWSRSREGGMQALGLWPPASKPFPSSNITCHPFQLPEASQLV